MVPSIDDQDLRDQLKSLRKKMKNFEDEDLICLQEENPGTHVSLQEIEIVISISRK